MSGVARMPRVHWARRALRCDVRVASALACEMRCDTYTPGVLTAFRAWIYRLLAFCVLVLTLGQVHVNTTGNATADEPGRDDTNISAEKGTR